MRPGAKGFLKVMVALVLLSLVFVVFTTWTEFGTIGADDPISHFMSETSRIGAFLFGLSMGVFGASLLWAPVAFAFHFWWPAKARWKIQDDYIKRVGAPKSAKDAEVYWTALLEIHRRA